MGCDIHLYVETLNAAGRWRPVDKWVRDDPDEDGRPGYLHVPYDEQFYRGRNYDLFGILADVRNGRGFAGVRTGDRFNPIAEPRGLPENCCDEIRECSDSWGIDGHSHSYFTVAELLAYDWTQTTKKRGCVDALTYAKWQRCREWQTQPDSWCGAVGGGQIQMLTQEEMNTRLQELQEKHKNNRPGFDEELGREPWVYVYCDASWEVAYYESVGSLWSSVIPRLLALGPQTDVRIVFWFDN